MEEKTSLKRVVIVGGGFAGIECALELIRRSSSGVAITLISNKKHLEYYPAMYRIVTGSSPVQACIPLSDIFDSYDISIEEDTIVECDPKAKKVVGASGSVYQGDYLVLTLGSQNTYFNIEGLEGASFNFKGIHQALHLRHHIHEIFNRAHKMDQEELLVALHFAIIGGGASGVELAGDLASYVRFLARMHNIPESMVTVDLIEGAPRVLPSMDPKVSRIARRRLNDLEVNIYNNRYLLKQGAWTVILKDMRFGARTVIWAAGIMTNVFYTSIKGFLLNKKGRVLVDEYMQAQNFPGVFIGGDAADTPRSGLAQTAAYDGKFIGRTIAKMIRYPEQRSRWKTYKPPRVVFDIPIGDKWAIFVAGRFVIHGWIAYVLRLLADLKYYISILSWARAFEIFFAKEFICPSCETCQELALRASGERTHETEIAVAPVKDTKH